MLSKKTQIMYCINEGKIMFDEKIVLMEGDNTGIIQLKGELLDNIKAKLIVKPPEGDNIPVTGTICPYKGISREFALPNRGTGKYKAQLVLQQGVDVNKSEIFEYEVLPSL